MKKCPNCQFENPDNAAFCGKCATPLSPAQPQPVQKNQKNNTPIIIAAIVAATLVIIAIIAAVVIINSNKGNKNNGGNDISSSYSTSAESFDTDETTTKQQETKESEPTREETTKEDYVRPPTEQIRLFSEYMNEVPIKGKLTKEFYYTEYFNKGFDFDFYDTVYIYFISFSGYTLESKQTNDDGSKQYTYVMDGTHRIVFYTKPGFTGVSYRNVYTKGTRYDESGKVIPEPKIAPSTTRQSSGGGGNNGGGIVTTVPNVTSGTTKSTRTCGVCYGTGDCQICYGSGTVRNPYVIGATRQCSACGGTGKCSSCGGDGQR